MIAPEFLAVSDWERHALVADLRGSFTGYGNTFPPPCDGTVLVGAGRISTVRISSAMSMAGSTSPATPACSAQARLRVATDNPGSPNVQAGLPDIRSMRRSAARLASTRTSTACRFPPAPRSTAPIYTILEADRRHLDQQRRPQLQPVRRHRPRQLRPDAGPEAVRGSRRRQPRRMTSSSTAAAMRAIPAAATSRAAPVSNSRGC